MKADTADDSADGKYPEQANRQEAGWLPGRSGNADDHLKDRAVILMKTFRN